MNKQITYGVILLVVIGVVAAALIYAFQPDIEESNQSNQVELAVPFESNGFRFAYPDGWRHQIPQTEYAISR